MVSWKTIKNTPNFYEMLERETSDLVGYWDFLHLFLVFHGRNFLPTTQRILLHGKTKK
ncbi:hypothetical protein LguiA_034609 [Lonicera macranthoides]